MSTDGIINPAQRQQLTELCMRFGVRRLEMFGSATTARFDPDTSDLDFLVEFEGLTTGDAADRYFGLLFALEELFKRSIDLVDVTAVDNPYFLRSIAPSRRVLYAA